MGSVFAEPGSKEDLERGTTFTPRFDENGLIACIAVEAATGAVLMLAWMNAEALEATIRTGKAHYYSRSRKKLWLKGETSGQIQSVRRMRTDCDQDALVIDVDVGGDGGACHTGAATCFYRNVAFDRERPGRSRLEHGISIFN